MSFEEELGCPPPITSEKIKVKIRDGGERETPKIDGPHTIKVLYEGTALDYTPGQTGRRGVFVVERDGKLGLFCSDHGTPPDFLGDFEPEVPDGLLEKVNDHYMRGTALEKP